MKLASSLLLLALALAVTGCNTPAQHRDLYRPSKGKGFWTTYTNKERDKEGLFNVSRSYHRGPLPEQGEGIFGISHPTY